MDDLNYNCYDRPTTEGKFTKNRPNKVAARRVQQGGAVLYWWTGVGILLKQHQLKEELTFSFPTIGYKI